VRGGRSCGSIAIVRHPGEIVKLAAQGRVFVAQTDGQVGTVRREMSKERKQRRLLLVHVSGELRDEIVVQILELAKDLANAAGFRRPKTGDHFFQGLYPVQQELVVLLDGSSARPQSR
jgi:hypothetical protein